VQHIFVGDVQGCAEELAELLGRVTDRFGEDFELWRVGDLVNRGPDSLSVLGQIRELEARRPGRVHWVLGNHEVSLLRCWLGLREPSVYDSFQDVLEAADVEDWMDWLRTRPIVCSGKLGKQRFALVHAGVHPDWSLGDLQREARRVEARLRAPIDTLRRFLGRVDAPRDDVLGRLTRCRSVDDEGGWSSDEPERGSRAWHEAWSERKHRYGVVYGHWAMQGLHVAAGLRGLDTGCVHHGRGRDGALTAWLPDTSSRRPFDVPDDGFWQIPARRAYYAHRDSLT
jgi:bis(5'-nucleosyl)-tetraphosphatase (symmetrical)